MTEITKVIATRVLETIDRGLTHGLGMRAPGAMCIEAAVCYALGLPHGDNPDTCVWQSLRSIKIHFNDSGVWDGPADRAKGLRRLGLLQLGSVGDPRESEFLDRLQVLAIGTWIPSALRAAASHVGEPDRAALIAAAEECERNPTRRSVSEASVIIRNVAVNFRPTSNVAACAFSNASNALDHYFDHLVYAPQIAADVGNAHTTPADRRAFYDQSILAVEAILIDMQVPGVRWVEGPDAIIGVAA